MTQIDQITRRRMAKTGLTAYDADKACPGYVLYTPMYGSGTPILLGLGGKEIHRWELPYPPGLYGYLLPNGNLFYLGKIEHDDTWDIFGLWKMFKGGVMMEVDWDGNVVWRHEDKWHHHDARRTESGGAVYLTAERMPDDMAAGVKGGVPGTDVDGMWADVIVEVDSGGDRIWEWHAYEHLDPETDVITYNDPRHEWSHANTVVPLPHGKVLVSFRNISTIGIIDKRTGEFEWKLGYDVLSQQHDPNLLPNGNVLVFDNGSHRHDSYLAAPASRVIEINPTTNDIVWEYHDMPSINFFSPYISGARRLPNGNTLITEGNFGRIFQVTPDGEVVWEYISPYFDARPDGMVVNAVFRSTFYTAQELPMV